MTKKALVITALVIAATMALEVAFRHLAHGEFWWHAVPGFDFAYGFLSCAAIVFVSKWLGHAFLQRKEDYYDAADSAEGTE